MRTVADLKAHADSALFAGRYADALAAYTRIVEVQPDNLDARLRVGDALMALGELQRAAVVYTSLSRHAALSGYPLRALLALKIVSMLEPKLGVLLHDIASLYARDSTRLGRSVRRAPPDAAQLLPATRGAAVPSAAEWPAHAQALAANYESAGLVYPDKLMPIPLLSLLPAEEFAGVLSALRLVRTRPDTIILREGEPGRSFFVLARGSVEVTTSRDGETKSLAKLHESAIFGEMALLSAGPRAATVTARTDCDLLEFDSAALSNASSTLAHLAAALTTFAQERLLSNVVSTSPIFRPLDPKQREDLMRRFVGESLDPGAVVIREGEAGQGLYVVLRGEVTVSRGQGAHAAELARLGPGEMFGEIALITREPTTASVRASEHGAAVLFLSRDYFDRLMQAVPELHAYLQRLSEDRLMDLRLHAVPDEPQVVDDEIEVEVLL
jgi:cAMP-dependent protein kinase regulator